jgi:hypothetical protein
MFQHEQNAATAEAWVSRVLGFVILYLGLLFITRPLELLGVPAWMLLPVAFIISLTVIALSWVAYRPFLAGPFLAIVAGFIYYRIRNRQHQLSSASVAAEADALTYTELEEHDLELQPTFKFQERIA